MILVLTDVSNMSFDLLFGKKHPAEITTDCISKWTALHSAFQLWTWMAVGLSILPVTAIVIWEVKTSQIIWWNILLTSSSCYTMLTQGRIYQHCTGAFQQVCGSLKHPIQASCKSINVSCIICLFWCCFLYWFPYSFVASTRKVPAIWCNRAVHGLP